MSISSRVSTLALVLLVVTTSLICSAVNLASAEDITFDIKEWQEFKEFQKFRYWKRSLRERGDKEIPRKYYGPDNEDRFIRKKHDRWIKKNEGIVNDPPPIDQAALMARYIVNQAGWTSVATVSSRKDTENYPFVNLISFSDGTLGNGTGIPYLFLTPLDFTAQDVFKDNRATIMVTLAEGRWCEQKNYDPMDPRCARVVFSGKIKAVNEDNPEYPIAKNAVYGRHPWLAHMPPDHHFFFAKLKIGTIALLDTFGGPKYITLDDYLHPPHPKSYSKYFEHYHKKEENDWDRRAVEDN